MMIRKLTLAGLGGLFLATALVGCATGEAPKTATGGTTTGGATAAAAGTINIDGSGTVFPIANALQELYSRENSGAKITVGKAGTGGGFEKFAKGEIDIATASRPIKPDEIEKAKAAGIEFIEIPIAYDALTMVVHPSNTWMTQVTLEELTKMWQKGATAKRWNEINPAWPAVDMKLYGPTEAHGTYDYFNETVAGKKDNVRSEPEIVSRQAEYEPMMVAISRDNNAFGFVGYAYYKMAGDKVKAVPVVHEGNPVSPSEASILDGTYTPFSRPLFFYVSKKAFETNPAVKGFVEFMLNPEKNAKAIASTGYVPLPADLYALAWEHAKAMKTGSVMQGVKPGTSFADVLKKAATN